MENQIRAFFMSKRVNKVLFVGKIRLFITRRDFCFIEKEKRKLFLHIFEKELSGDRILVSNLIEGEALYRWPFAEVKDKEIQKIALSFSGWELELFRNQSH